MIPTVSIGMPVYNGSKYIAAAIESIRAQTFENWELIISDNASSDDTEEICRAAKRSDSRIRYIQHQTNYGAAANYNRVVQESSGRYFKWASHDDECGPTLLEHCVLALDADDSVVLAYPRTVIIDAEGLPIGDYDDRMHPSANVAAIRVMRVSRMLRLCNVVFGLIRKKDLMRTGLIRAFAASDIVLIAELATIGRFALVAQSEFCRRVHSDMSRAQHRSSADVMSWFDTSKSATTREETNLRMQIARALWELDVATPTRLSCILSYLGGHLERKARVHLGRVRRQYQSGRRLAPDVMPLSPEEFAEYQLARVRQP